MEEASQKESAALGGPGCCVPVPAHRGHDISEVPSNTAAHHGLPFVPLAKTEERDARQRTPAHLPAGKGPRRPRVPARALEIGPERGVGWRHVAKPRTQDVGEVLGYLGLVGASDAIIAALMMVRDFKYPSWVSTDTMPATAIAAS